MLGSKVSQGRLPLCNSRRLSSKGRVGVRASASTLVREADLNQDVQIQQQSLEQRQKFAEAYGYEQVGKELPSNVTLTDIIRSMPKEVFEIKEYMGVLSVALCLSAVAGSLYLISVTPWFLLPVSWFIAGTAWTGLFVLGHDCGHRTFSKNKLYEDIVGTLLFMPLAYPFEPWRIKHNHHHTHTNKLTEDTAWVPVTEEDIDNWNPVARAFYTFFLATPLKFFASVAHQIIWHFNLDLYTEKQKPRVIVSLAAVALWVGAALPAITYFFGVEGLVKYWLMPWLGYHFWMSTFTVIHHTAPHIPFRMPSEWNAAQAQLNGSVHCDFPKWIEVLCFDISVHVPHHVSSSIPWYNLRKAYASLKENWGEYLTTAKWNWKLMRTIVTELHVYDEKVNYKPFDEYYPVSFLPPQRKMF